MASYCLHILIEHVKRSNALQHHIALDLTENMVENGWKKVVRPAPKSWLKYTTDKTKQNIFHRQDKHFFIDKTRQSLFWFCQDFCKIKREPTSFHVPVVNEWRKKFSGSQPDKYFTRKYLTNSHRVNQPPTNQPTYQPISQSVPQQKFLYL